VRRQSRSKASSSRAIAGVRIRWSLAPVGAQRDVMISINADLRNDIGVIRAMVEHHEATI
jgi:hypothetical protein